MEGNSASQRLLQNSDLMDNILLRLPIEDLFLNQKVSKGFKATIENSTRLRREDVPRLPRQTK